MANALKESYMRGSNGMKKMGDMRLDRVNIRQADDGTFIVECSYKAEHKRNGKGDMPYPSYEEKVKTAKDADELMDLIEDMFGD